MYIWRRINLTNECGYSLVDEGFKLTIVDNRKGELKNVSMLRLNRGEEAVKKDGMEDSFTMRSAQISLAFSSSKSTGRKTFALRPRSS